MLGVGGSGLVTPCAQCDIFCITEVIKNIQEQMADEVCLSWEDQLPITRILHVSDDNHRPAQLQW